MIVKGISFYSFLIASIIFKKKLINNRLQLINNRLQIAGLQIYKILIFICQAPYCKKN
jgi:hypothetical protein